MRKNTFGWHLKRDTDERKALFKGLASALVLRERIITTEAKAKAVKPYVEKIVTKARKGDKFVRFVEPYLTLDAVSKMMNDISQRFLDRPGGYVRMVHAGNRVADNAPLMMMEWVEKKPVLVEKIGKKVRQKKSIKQEAAKTAVKDPVKKDTKKVVKKPAVKKSNKK